MVHERFPNTNKSNSIMRAEGRFQQRINILNTARKAGIIACLS